jgi:trehalose-6-phosphatase
VPAAHTVDATDEDAFAALPDGIIVRVDGAPKTAAQYYVAEPGEVLQFLERLDERLRRRGVGALARLR